MNTDYFHYAAVGFAVGVACTVGVLLVLFTIGTFVIT